MQEQRSNRKSREMPEANIAEREARQDREHATIVSVHPLTNIARPTGAKAAEDDDPKAVMRRVEGGAQRTE